MSDLPPEARRVVWTFAVIVVFGLIVLVSNLGHHGPDYSATTQLTATGRYGSVMVDVWNNGSSDGTPDCTLDLNGYEGSVLASQPFYPGQVIAGTDNLVTVQIQGIDVARVAGATASCS